MIKLFARLLVLVFMLGIFSSCEKKPNVEWEKYTPELMEELQAGNEPIFAYFYAAWCGPCHYLKEQTYSDLRVIEAMNSFRRVKLDMSFKHSPKIIALHEKYRVRGLPHMIMMYPGQDSSKWLRVGGFVKPNVLLSAIQKFKNQTAVKP